ncbi:hypothetical protein A6K26_009485, partial [Gammaproteobacteria bacterium 2W06]
MALLGAAVIGLLIGRLEEFWARFGGEPKNGENDEAISSDLLLAVSSASPVPLPDVPPDILDQKSRFTIVLEQETAAPDSLLANTPGITTSEQALAGAFPDLQSDRSEEGDDDQGIFFWRGDGGSTPAISQAESASRQGSTGEILSETRLPQDDGEPRGMWGGVEPPPEAITASDPRFVSITQLNEQMGPPAPEDDDDEGGWLWFGDGPGAWLVSAAAGLFGGGLGGAGAAAPLGEVAVTGLNIGFTAGPFVDGKLAIRAVDGQGNQLFVYNGESPGETLGTGVTLTGVATDTVAGQRVITGLEVRFDDFSGPVFLQVEDTSAYIDEALGTETPLDIPLRGSAEVPSEGIGEIGLTPFTELAIQLIEQATGELVTLDASNADDLAASRQLLDSAADRVRDLTGVDIRDTRPVAVNQTSFQSTADLDANQYGLKLAALSELSGNVETDTRVQTAIDALTENVSPGSDAAGRTIVFQNPGTALRNQTEFTDSLDAFVDRDETIRERVVDADRPDTPPTIGDFLVIDDVPVIEGAAQFIDQANTAGEDSNLSLSVALGDDTVFSVDADGGSGDGALAVVETGDADTAGTWRLTLSDLDPGAYSLDVFVVDGASNTTQAEGRDADNAPVIQFIGEGVVAPDDATVVRRTFTEGDDAAAVSTTGRLAIGDLDAGETVRVLNSELVEITGDTEVLDVGEGVLGGYFSLPVGQVLDEREQIAFEDWDFSGNAAVFDRLGIGESVTLSHDFLVIDSDLRVSNNARLEITVEGTNDAPEVSGEINVAADAGDAITTVDLLADATDADVNDTLSVTDLSFSVNGSPTGDGGSDRPEGISLDGTSLIVESDSPAFEDLPLGETRVIEASYTITDGNGGTVTQTATITLTGTEVIEPPSNAPTITVTANDFTEDDGAVAEDAVVATYTTADEEGDDLTVTFTSAVPEDGSGNALYTLDTANSEVLLTSAGVAYVNAGNDLPAVDLTVTDDGSPAETGTGSADPTVTLVNDAPVLDSTEDPSLTAIGEDIQNANNAGTAVSSIVVDGSITDEDGSAVQTIYVTAVDETNGSWQFSTDSGSNWTTIDFSSEPADTGLLLDRGDKIRFVPDADFNGSADLTFGAWDKSTGSAGAYVDVSSTGADTAFSSATDTASITVTPVNDAPSGTDKTVTVDEDATYTLKASNFGFSDPKDGDAFDSVVITTLPSNGSLELDGSVVSSGDSITVAAISSGDLTFTPAADANGSGYASFDFQVVDDGGTGNGGVDTDQSANTLTVDVTAVNDAPV